MKKTLNEMYDGGEGILPGIGWYSVEMQFNNTWYEILNKKIHQDGSGTNHPPGFILRRFGIGLMDFSVHKAKGEIIFLYTKIPIEDRLKNIALGTWLGKIYYRGKFVDYFKLIEM